MPKLFVFLVSMLLLPVAAVAATLNISGNFDYEGDDAVDAFSFSFDTVVNVDDTSAPFALPVSGGPVVIGETSFADTFYLWFRTSPFGDFAALITSQKTRPSFDNDYFQISAVFAPGTTLDSIEAGPLATDLRSLDYIVWGDTPELVFGRQQGLGMLRVSAVPVPASGALFGAVLLCGAFHARRKNAK